MIKTIEAERSLTLFRQRCQPLSAISKRNILPRRLPWRV
jgi:hypothetical protein